MRTRMFHYVELVILIIMIPFETTKYVCMSSVFIGISAIILYLLEVYDFSFFMGILCMTSLNHWRKYELGGWRQRIDLTWVNICFVYFTKNILYKGTEFQQYLAFSVLICMILFFQISKSSIQYWLIFHMAIHLYVSFFVPMLFLL